MSRESHQRLTARPLVITPDPLPHLEGSAIIETGKTKVLCAVSLERSVPKWLAGRGSGWLTAEYSLMPGSTVPRARRERSKVSGRTQEIQRLIGRSLRSAFHLNHLGENTLHIDCDVLCADGGTRTAAISGAYVAAALAVRRMIGRGEIQADVFHRQVAAISVGIVGGAVTVDLDYQEDSSADVDMNIVLAKDAGLVEVQGTGERTTYSRKELNSMLDGAEYACKSIFAAQIQAIEAGITARQV